MRQTYFKISLFLVTAFFAGMPFFVLAATNVGGTKEEIIILNQEISARKDKIKQLEDTIESYKKTIAQKQTEAVSLKNQLSILDNRIAQTTTDVALTNEKIAATEDEIKALELSIGDKQKTIERQKKIIVKMVESIHASDQKNLVEIMLTYSDFSKFYDEVKNAQTIYIDLGRSIKSLRLVKQDLNERKTERESKKRTLETLRTQLVTKQDNLSEQVSSKKTLLSQTKSSETKYRTLLSSLKSQYQVIEGEVRTFEARVRKRLEEEDRIKQTGSVEMSWPTPSHIINSYFHDVDYPYRNVFEHSGIDIKAPQGTPIRAVASGYVAKARRCSASSCYAYVILVHTGSISTLYGHLSSISVMDDAFVNRGDIIGYSGGRPGTVGAGPFVTGPHLHFEVRANGIPVNPLGYLFQ